MNILFYTKYFYPHIGGVEKHVEKVSLQLINQGHKITIVTSNYSLFLKKQEIYKGILIKRINVPKIKYFGLIFLWIYELVFLIKFFAKFDVIHCHDVFLWYLPFRFIFINKPVFCTFHGYEGYPLTFKEILLRKISEKLSWGNICVGKFISKWYKTKANIITYGAADFIKSTIPNNTCSYDAVFWGRLDNDTSILEYDKLVGLLKQRMGKFSWLIIGQGNLKKHIKNSDKISVFKKNVTFEICSSKIAFASGYLSIMEALILKRPVVAFYSNLLKKDYLKSSPFSKYIFITNNLEEAYVYTKSLLNNSKKHKSKIIKGYHWASKQTWLALSKKYLKLWQLKCSNC